MVDVMSNLDNQIDEVLRSTVDHAYEIMDSKSFADPYTNGREAIKSLVESECRKARIDELIRSNEWVGGNIGGNLCKRMYTQYYLTRLSALKEETNG